MSRIRVVPVGSDSLESNSIVSEKPLYFPYFLQVKHQTQHEALHPIKDVVDTALNEVDEIQLRQGLLNADAAEEAQQIMPYEIGMQQPMQVKPRIGPIGLAPELMKPLETSQALPHGTTGVEFDPAQRPQRLNPVKPTPITATPMSSLTSTTLTPEQQQNLKEQAKRYFTEMYKAIHHQDPNQRMLDDVVPKLADMTQTLFNVKK